MHVLHRSMVRFSTCLLAVVVASTTLAADAPLFNRDIRPILSANCFQCHGPDDKHREAELRLDDEEGIISAFSGKLAESEGWQRITSNDPDLRMPPVDSHLDTRQLGTLLGCHERIGNTFTPHASCSTNAMNVIVAIFRHIVVDDQWFSTHLISPIRIPGLR